MRDFTCWPHCKNFHVHIFENEKLILQCWVCSNSNLQIFLNKEFNKLRFSVMQECGPDEHLLSLCFRTIFFFLQISTFQISGQRNPTSEKVWPNKYMYVFASD